MIWGIVGMFLSVPIMVLVMIICAHIPGWRMGCRLVVEGREYRGIKWTAPVAPA